MSTPTAQLSEVRLTVRPGERSTTTVRISNPAAGPLDHALDGTEFVVSIPPYSGAASWATFRVVSPAASAGPASPAAAVAFLRPGERAEVEVAFEVPDGPSVPAGEQHFVVAVEPRDNRHQPTSVEGTLVVEGVPAITSRMLTTRARGRTAGRFRLGVANTGSLPVDVVLSSDADVGGPVVVTWSPQQVRLSRREHDEFLVTLLARQPRHLGGGTTHQVSFTATARTSDGRSVTAGPHSVDFEQRPWIPLALVPVLALLLMAAVWAVAALYPGRDDAVAVGPSATLSPVTVAPASGDGGTGPANGSGGSSVGAQPVDRFRQPWVLFYQSSTEPPANLLVSIRSAIAAQPHRFSPRARSQIDVVALPDAATGPVLAYVDGAGLTVQLNGKRAIADVGGGLSADDAVEYCRSVLGELAGGTDNLTITCVAFDDAGQGRMVGPGAGAGGGSS